MTRRCAVLIGFLCAAGCVWRSYATIMGVHLDVLTQTAAKLCAVVQAGRGPTAEDMAEYDYPLQRAREFLGQFRGYSERQSYRRFAVLLDRYAALVREVDAARAAGRALQPELAHWTVEHDALQQLATEIRGDLQAGR
ncbi:MAG TPA: hypothetical protein VN812_18335 [Candidatus Acidoferrales bacterium]|nr:hypothetical protein [Candidatus Acidoferrales bacterium]